MRAWHVIMANGADQTVTAHDLDNFGGTLSFTTHQYSGDDRPVIVRAFAPAAWRDVELVPTDDNVPICQPVQSDA